MIKFILNNKTIVSKEPSGMPLLEFIRYHQHLTGTKTGCNEGDCGACTILVGDLMNGALKYKSYTSCLTPLGKVHGKHVVTIEGLNKEVATGDKSAESLNPIQMAMYEESATQCGFCTPGFVVSMAGFCLGDQEPTAQNVIACMDGNICRCTGYKSIERAAIRVAALMENRNGETLIDYAIKNEMLSGWFKDIQNRLVLLNSETNGGWSDQETAFLVGGGTDLYVQKHDDMKELSVRFIAKQASRPAVMIEGGTCIISPEATVTDLMESRVFQQYFPRFNKHVKLVSSTQIRNMATIAGNFVNGSPIGDFTIFFLALDAQLILKENNSERQVALRKFYKGYKTLDKTAGEFIDRIWFELPEKDSLFNFEKISKRTNLDIASVNTAIQVSVKGGLIHAINISAGGVGPIPKCLEKTSAFLLGKAVSESNMEAALEMAQTEISPISDARGAEAYKRLLLNQLIKAHFIELYPAAIPALV